MGEAALNGACGIQILQEGIESSRRQLLIEAFVSAGRVDNITMVMGLHPQYLSSFWKTQYLLLRMDGPLPYHKRHYIAIMVSVGPRLWAVPSLRSHFGVAFRVPSFLYSQRADAGMQGSPPQALSPGKPLWVVVGSLCGFSKGWRWGWC